MSKRNGLEQVLARAVDMKDKVFSAFQDHQGQMMYFIYLIDNDTATVYHGLGHTTTHRGEQLGPPSSKGLEIEIVNPKDLWLEACFESTRRLRASAFIAMTKESLKHEEKEITGSGPKGRSPSGKRAKRDPKRNSSG
jgi:hypothetical protein